MAIIDSQSIEVFSNLILRKSNIDASTIFTSDSIDGLSVYQNNYLLSLMGSLKSKFIITEKILGEENFRALTAQFVLASPSRSQNLDDYGEGFDHFLSDVSELEEIGYIKYIASLDMFWFHAEENRANEIKLPTEILKLWAALANDIELEELAIDEEKLESIRIGEKDKEMFLIGKVNV